MIFGSSRLSTEQLFVNRVIANQYQESYDMLSTKTKSQFSSEQWKQRVRIDSSWAQGGTSKYVGEEASTGAKTFHAGKSHDKEGEKQGIYINVKLVDGKVDYYSTVKPEMFAN